MATTMCLSGSVIVKAGKGVNSTITDGSLKGGDGTTFIVDEWINQAEGKINSLTRFNWTDVYTSDLNADVKEILQDTCSSFAAIKAVIYDMSSYTSRVEAEDIVNVLRDNALLNISILRDKKVQRFIQEA